MSTRCAIAGESHDTGANRRVKSLFLESLLHLNETERTPSYVLGDVHEDIVPSIEALPPLDHDAPTTLSSLLNVPHTSLTEDTSEWPSDMLGDSPPGYLTTAYEDEYITNLDSQLTTPELLTDGWKASQLPRSRQLPVEKELLNQNPMSVLSWLRRYHPETFIQEKEAAAERLGKSKSGGGGGKRSSMATITSAANTGTPQPHPKEEAPEEVEEEVVPVVEEKAAGRIRKTKDDEAYRPKGGSSRPSAKRKRGAGGGGEEGAEKAAPKKRARASGAAATAGTPS